MLVVVMASLGCHAVEEADSIQLGDVELVLSMSEQDARRRLSDRYRLTATALAATFHAAVNEATIAATRTVSFQQPNPKGLLQAAAHVDCHPEVWNANALVILPRLRRGVRDGHRGLPNNALKAANRAPRGRGHRVARGATGSGA